MPANFHVLLSAEAEANVEAAYSWIAEADPEAAARWYDGLIQALTGLARFPARCPVAPETRLGFVNVEMRQLLYGRHFWKYRILFTIAGDEIHIAHIRHGARLFLRETESEG